MRYAHIELTEANLAGTDLPVESPIEIVAMTVPAQVTENVYDSLLGRTLLMPQGSRLIGSYDSVVVFG